MRVFPYCIRFKYVCPMLRLVLKLVDIIPELLEVAHGGAHRDYLYPLSLQQ